MARIPKYYAIQGDPYTHPHMFQLTAQNGQELVHCCRVVRMKSIGALASVLGSIVVPVSMDIVPLLQC